MKKCGMCKSKVFNEKCEVCRFNRNLGVTRELLRQLQAAAKTWNPKLPIGTK